MRSPRTATACAIENWSSTVMTLPLVRMMSTGLAPPVPCAGAGACASLSIEAAMNPATKSRYIHRFMVGSPLLRLSRSTVTPTLSSFVCPAGRGIPSRPIRDLFEGHGGRVGTREVLGIVHDRRHHEPTIAVGLGERVEVLVNGGGLAVGNAVPPQVSAGHLRRPDAQLARAFLHTAAAARAEELP